MVVGLIGISTIQKWNCSKWSTYGEQFVNKWLHNGFVTVGMKTKDVEVFGISVTVHDLLQQIDDSAVLRFFMATTQSSRHCIQIVIWNKQHNLDRIRTGYRNLEFRLADAIAVMRQLRWAATELVDQFNAAMDDDFNAPNALTAIYGLVDLANQYTSAEVVYQDTNFILIKSQHWWVYLVLIAYQKMSWMMILKH